MNADVPARLTTILQRARLGEPTAVDELLSHVYEELRGLARAYLHNERRNHTLQPTALVHEAYVKMIDGAKAAWQDRTHFFATAARCMRQILVDHARRKKAGKRGGGRQRVDLDAALAQYEGEGVDVLALHEALERLAALDERKSQVVELRFFGGLTADEAAETLGVSGKTVEADWYMARAWLRRELEREK